MTRKPKHKNTLIKESWEKHPDPKILLALFKRQLTMQETLRVFEHTSKCKGCYEKLKTIMTGNTKTKP